MRSANKLAVLAVIVTALLFAGALLSAPPQQDKMIIEIMGDLRPIKLAVADVRENYRTGTPPTAPLAFIFNDVLWKDLDSSGLFTLVSKSLYPKEIPGSPQDLPGPKLELWKAPPVEAQALAFANMTTTAGGLMVEGYLFDPNNKTQPMVFGRRYPGQPGEDSARLSAHRFANDIISRLGGGIPGIAESRIYFVSARTGSKEIWSMDYDGANQHQVTHYGNITIDPAVTLDGSKLAYTSYVKGNPDIYVLSLDTGRMLPFSNQKGPNFTPAWSPDGNRLAFCAAFPGDTELFVSNASGGGVTRLTNVRGVDIEAAWNPRTPQIAFVSDRGGLPQIYLMDSDGSSVRRISAGTGEAVNPAWHPNGQKMAFAWTRGFAPGNYNIFVMDVASGNFVQLTHGEGKNEHPSWAPDGRHLVFQSNRGGRTQIYTMLADGTQVHALTSAGENQSPVWSAK